MFKKEDVVPVDNGSFIRYKPMAVNVKFKKLHANTQVPTRATDGSAGFDLVAVTEVVKNEKTGPMVEYDTHLAVEIPEGYVGLIFPRSSITSKTTLMLGNCVGVIDSDYRGSIKFQFRQVNQFMGKKYNLGERIGQIVIMPIPDVQFEEVTELSDTSRGEKGFGSSGT